MLCNMTPFHLTPVFGKMSSGGGVEDFVFMG